MEPIDLSTPRLGDAVHPAYDNPRPEVVNVVPTSASRILDLGCSTGAVAAALKNRGHQCHVTGVEVDPELAAIARDRADAIVELDLEQLAAGSASSGELGDEVFDCVIAADVLEHLRDPWAVARWAATKLRPGGYLVISVPNVYHLHTFRALLLQRRWRYDDVGIFDRTHLRFFTRRNLPGLLAGTGMKLERVERVPMLSFNPASRLNRVAPYLGDIAALQLVALARKDGQRDPSP